MINSTLFLSCIELFANSVPDSVTHLIVLVYDGCCNHYNYYILKEAVELKVILVLFPANVTNLIQILDIAVFKPFNSVLKHCVSGFMLENAIATITKKYAMTVVSKAWIKFIQSKTTNIASGFISKGLRPLYFTSMQF